MSYTVIFLSRALQELTEAWEWYENRKSGLGDEFKDRLINRVKNIKSYPERFPERKKAFREIKLKTFPYLIIYKIDNKRKVIAIVSVFHTSRNPNKKYKP